MSHFPPQQSPIGAADSLSARLCAKTWASASGRAVAHFGFRCEAGNSALALASRARGRCV
jgi:hypothetical protein